MPCEKHGPRASVTTKTSAFGLGFCLLSPSGHVFHTAWETMIKSYSKNMRQSTNKNSRRLGKDILEYYGPELWYTWYHGLQVSLKHVITPHRSSLQSIANLDICWLRVWYSIINLSKLIDTLDMIFGITIITHTLHQILNFRSQV